MKSFWHRSTATLWAAVAWAALIGSAGILTSHAADSAQTASAIADAKPASVAENGAASSSSSASANQPASTQTAYPEKALPAKVLFITAKNSPDCDKVLGKLNWPNGDFDKMRAAGWKIGKGPGNHLQIVDKDEVPDLLKQLGKQEFPTVASVDKDGQVVRYFRFGCTTPLDMWTFGFLAKGIDERPAGFVMEAAKVEWTGHYPLRGNHWSVEGNWNPTKEETVAHLHGPNHQAQLQPEWHIEDWSLEELRSLHDDLHEKYDTGTYNGGGLDNSSSGGADYLKFKGKG
ncbi:MAG TPA: hypothetical protein VMJ32_02900 [Pirellulales bacterium]|nr:hypothetical protein [Pirellulales bacterium]